MLPCVQHSNLSYSVVTCACSGGLRWIVNLQKPGSVQSATVAIALKRGTCGPNPACWAYVSHTLPVWMAKSMILQVSPSPLLRHITIVTIT